MLDRAHSLVSSLCILCSNHTGDVIDVDADDEAAVPMPVPVDDDDDGNKHTIRGTVRVSGSGGWRW